MVINKIELIEVYDESYTGDNGDRRGMLVITDRVVSDNEIMEYMEEVEEEQAKGNGSYYIVATRPGILYEMTADTVEQVRQYIQYTRESQKDRQQDGVDVIKLYEVDSKENDSKMLEPMYDGLMEKTHEGTKTIYEVGLTKVEQEKLNKEMDNMIKIYGEEVVQMMTYKVSELVELMNETGIEKYTKVMTEEGYKDLVEYLAEAVVYDRVRHVSIEELFPTEYEQVVNNLMVEDGNKDTTEELLKTNTEPSNLDRKFRECTIKEKLIEAIKRYLGERIPKHVRYGDIVNVLDNGEVIITREVEHNEEVKHIKIDGGMAGLLVKYAFRTVISESDYIQVRLSSRPLKRAEKRQTVLGVYTVYINQSFNVVEELDLADDKVTDHINRDSLDNRLVNLRELTVRENHWNSYRAWNRDKQKELLLKLYNGEYEESRLILADVVNKVQRVYNTLGNKEQVVDDRLLEGEDLLHVYIRRELIKQSVRGEANVDYLIKREVIRQVIEDRAVDVVKLHEDITELNKAIAELQ